jgi:hypothetical protein
MTRSYKMENLSQNSLNTIQEALNENPEEEYFGTESFSWETEEEAEEMVYFDPGYIYPARGGYGNMATYHSREELEEVLSQGY